MEHLLWFRGGSATTFKIKFKKEHDIATKITYKYVVNLQSTLADKDLENVETPDETGFTYSFNESRAEASVTGLTSTNTQTSLTIPSMVAYEGKMYTVTIIEANAFKGKNITSVVIPNTVNELKASVFENCSKLTHVTIPNSVTKLGNKEFKGCKSLVDIYLPNTITSVGTSLFSGCSKLENYNIPIGITKLTDRMFENCAKFTTFNFPTQIRTLGNYVFNGCNFETLNIPDTITSLTQNTFSGITNITELTVPCSVTCLDGADNGLFGSVDNIENSIIEATNKGNEIGKAFICAENLKSVKIESGINVIKNDAFNGCMGLTKVITPSIEDWLAISFGNVTSNPLDYAHDLFTSNGTQEEMVTNLVIPSTVSTIKDYAFYNSTITTVTISSEVTTIGKYAFNNCTNLTDVIFANNSQLQTINSYVFNGCSELSSITIPNSVTSIKEGAFSSCTGLTKVITQNIESWLNISFEDWASNPLSCAHNLYQLNGTQEKLVTNVEIPNTFLEIKDNVFVGCTSIESITIPNSIKSIGGNAFSSCSNLINLSIPSSVLTINDWAFSGCSGLLEIVIPESVQSIRIGVFKGCTSLTSIYIPSTVTTISASGYNTSPFYNCSNTLTIYTDVVDASSKPSGWGTYWNYRVNVSQIPVEWGCSLEEYEGIINLSTLYPDFVFKGTKVIGYNGNSEDIIVPEGVTGIAGNNSTFSEKSFIHSVQLPTTLNSLDSGAFYNCSGLSSITIPDNITKIGGQAFYNCFNLTRVEISSIESWLRIKFNSEDANPLYYAHHLYIGENEVSGEINVPNSITKINDYAFTNFLNMSSIILPNSVTKIGMLAFSNCVSLKQVFIPNSVTTISASNYTDSPFRGCLSKCIVYAECSEKQSGWEKYWNCYDSSNHVGVYFDCTIEGMNETVALGNNAEFNIVGKKITRYVGSSKDVIIPDGVKEIASYAFSNCTKINSITIPSSVTSIGSYAFEGCVGLTKVTISDLSCWVNISFSNEMSNPLYYAHHLFVGEEELIDVEIPHNITTIKAYAFYGCTNISKVTIDSLEHWLNMAFSNEYSNPIYYAKKLFIGENELTNLVIPNTTQKINRYAFINAKNLISLTFAEGSQLEEIGYYSFMGCTQLTNINIPEGVKTLSQYAFNSCSSLVSISFPSTLETISLLAFGACNNLKRVDIPSLKDWLEINFEMNDWGINYHQTNPLFHTHELYANGELVTEIIIPDSISKINVGAFARCTSITSVIIPSHVTSVGADAFYACSKLASVTIMGGNISIYSKAFFDCNNINNVVTSSIENWLSISFNTEYSNPLCYAHKLYIDNNEVNELIIPNTISKINNYQFYGCESIKKVKIPNSITNIGTMAFRLCYNIVEVANLSSLSISAGDSNYGFVAYYSSVVYNDDDNDKIVNDGVVLYYKENEEEYHVIGLIDKTITDIQLNQNVTIIRKYAFYKCNNVKNIIIPKNVTTIEDFAFGECTDLLTVTFEENSELTSIGMNAFSGCVSLKKFIIPSGVETIGRAAFENCYRLVEVYNYSGLNLTAGGTTFAYSKVIYSGESLSAESKVINEDGIIYYVYDENSYYAIGISDYTLTSIQLNSKTTQILNYAFYGCFGINSVTIPSGVQSIGNNAFFGCSGLTRVETARLEDWLKITFGNSSSNPLYYAKSLYIGENKLTELVIPNTITQIKAYAFCGYLGLNSVVIPSSVQSIGNGAFSGCSELTRVETARLEDWLKITFVNDSSNPLYYAKSLYIGENKLTELVIPDTITQIKSNAFYGCSGLNSVVIPSSVQSIGDGAFYGCSELTRVETASLEDWLKITFGNYSSNPLCYAHHLFVGQDELTEIEIPDTITQIKAYAFYGCTNLRKVTVDSIEHWLNITFGNEYSNPLYYAKSLYIGENKLTELVIPDTITQIKAYVFYNCLELTSVTIPGGVKSIGSCAFRGCIGISDIFIPIEVVTINATSYEAPFYGCLSSLTIYVEANSKPSGWGSHWNDKNSSNNTFDTAWGISRQNYENIKLFSKQHPEFNFTGTTITGYQGNDDFIIIPECITNISSLSSRTYIKGIQLSNALKIIGQNSLKNLAQLTSIIIPESVTSIGNNAFEYCTNLKNVTIESANIYIAAAGVSNSHAGRILGYAKTINVLASVVDDTNNTNSFLNDTTKYTKSAKHVIGDDNKEYYTYTKVS